MIRLCFVLLLGAFSLFSNAGFAQSKNPSFTLVNKAASPIRELFVTPAGDANWGQNRLRSGAIAPGGQFAVERKTDGNCVFDVRVVYADGRKEDRRTVNTCTEATLLFTGNSKVSAPAAPAKALDDPSFRLTNHLKQAVAELYASPTGQPRGSNLLEKGALIPDATLTIHPPRGHGCEYKLELVFADKSDKTRTLDLCKTNDLSIP